MIIVLKPNPDQAKLDSLKDWLTKKELQLHVVDGATSSVIGLIGDTAGVDTKLIEQMEIVESVKRIQEPYKKANRKFHAEDSVIDVNGVKIGGGNFIMIAGPCSVESEAQICDVANAVKKSGAKILRGGAFKPRTSPYAFQGLKADGLDLLELAKKQTGMPIVSEVMDLSQLPLFENVDIIQIGARNMQNFELLKKVGTLDKPILLKRGLSATIDELLMSAEYIMAGGNQNVILCERGIRTYETATRNTLDLSCIPVLKEKTHLPIIIDPSHAIGISRFVPQMSLAAVAAGADGLIIEVHNDPANALCDGQQSLTPEEYDNLSKKVDKLLVAFNDL